MWGGKRVSLILPIGDGQDSIERVLDTFEVAGVIDEIVVVRHDATPGPRARVGKIRTREVVAPRPGPGAAIRCGFREAGGDFLLVADPDGSFCARDVRKLLAYAEDFDVVYGSRTVAEPVWQGGPIGLLRKWGHFAVSKLLEGLFNTPSLTDVGCTFRCIRREALRELEPLFTVDDSSFGPEMMVLSILRGQQIIQIPVNYTRRAGASSVTGNQGVAFALGLRMIALILDYRLRSWLAPGCFRGNPWPDLTDPLPALDLVLEPYDAEEEKER